MEERSHFAKFAATQPPKGVLNEGVPNFSTASPEGTLQTEGSVETRHREECERITHI